MRFLPSSPALACLLLLAVATGCGSMRGTRFVNPDFNFSFVERVAVLPLENFSRDDQAGVRATRLLITELLATGAVDVVGIGEVKAALTRAAGGGQAPSSEQVIALGKALNVQGVMVGSVAQSEEIASGRVKIPVVTLDLHLVEVETGATVWAATQSERGGSAGARFFGTAGEPLSETTRRCARKIVKLLVD